MFFNQEMILGEFLVSMKSNMKQFMNDQQCIDMHI